jgi:hypothetical protein
MSKYATQPKTVEQLKQEAMSAAVAAEEAKRVAMTFYERKAAAEKVLKEPEVPIPIPSQDDSSQWAEVAAAQEVFDLAVQKLRTARGNLIATKKRQEGKDVAAQERARRQSAGAINEGYFFGWKHHVVNMEQD